MFPLRDTAAPDHTADIGQRERNRLRTRSDLNGAAIRLFADRGYDSTSVEDICAEAGVSVRTFFRYFDGKEDVLFARQMDMGGFLERIAAQPAGVPPLEAIRRAYLEQPRLTAEEIEISVLFQLAMATSTILQGRYVEGLDFFRGEVAAALATRAGRIEPGEADVLAATIGQSTLDHAYKRWIVKGTRGDLRKAVDSAFRLLHDLTADEQSGLVGPSTNR